MFRKVIEEIEKKAAETIRAEQGDYIVDGLLHCGKCRTPKQCRVELFGEVRTPYCMCECESARYEQAKAEHKRREFERHIAGLRNAGFPDGEMKKWTFSADDMKNEKVTAVMKRYVENFGEMMKGGKGLLLFGTVGTGKTFAAACVANALIDKGIPCMVTNFARLINTIHGLPAGKQDYIDGLNRYKLLVIDDLASERDTEYMNETILNIIDSRYRSGLPLIVTTNLSAEEMKNTNDVRKQRIYSRLFDMCIPIRVEGSDRRRMKMQHDYNLYREMLGL